jgi:hypothetical protein
MVWRDDESDAGSDASDRSKEKVRSMREELDM